MKKRLMCMLLCAIMVLSVLMTGCSGQGASEEDIAGAGIREVQTLVVYLMSEAPVDQKTENAVEDAINELTKSKFKTQLDLHFFTEDVYYEKVEEKLKAKEKEIKAAEKAAKDKKKYEKWLRESCKEAGISYVPVTTPKPETVVTEEATLVDADYGIIKYVYPDPEPNQLDIFYVGGYENYMKYVNENWLARLNDEIDMSSKKLKEHIPSIYMDNVRDSSNNGIYGIPTNSAIGTYTWLLLNKELMENYFYTEDSINYLLDSDTSTAMDEDFYNFLNDVNTYERDKYVPLRGELEPVNIFYWTMNTETLRLTNEPSVIGSAFSPIAMKGTPLTVSNLFGTVEYTNQIKMIKRFEFAGFFEKEGEEDKPFAASVVKGGYDIFEKYSDEYYVKMIERPRASEDDIYSDMLCVGAMEDNIARAMEIVTYINTNSAPRNIIQYGIEGENYYVDDFGVLHRYNQAYMMDVKKTGNVFMAHPEEGRSPDYWDEWVSQIEDSRVYPTFGFIIEWSSKPDTEKIVVLQELYNDYMDRLNACTTVEEIDAFFTEAKEEINVNEDFLYVKNANYGSEETDTNPNSPIMKLYWNWLLDNDYVGD